MDNTDDNKNPFEVTAELRSVNHLLALHRGLYLQYFENSGADPVHDRNGESRGGGKLLVRPRGTSLEIGKFENGFLVRRAEDAIHMHRRPASVTPPLRPYNDEFVYAPALGTYMDCLKRVYVLDLVSSPKPTVREAEKELRGALDGFLSSRALFVQDFRGDWRILVGDVPEDLLVTIDMWVRSTFVGLSERYSAPTA